MLIQKQADSNDIVSIKLITNEEIIARLVQQDDSTVTIQRPLIMAITPDDKGRIAIQMMPFFSLGGRPDARIQLQRSHMLFMTISNDEARAGYIQNTSGIEVPSQGGRIIS
jgi:hypothetical protein